MTVVVGVLTDRGAVMAADRRTTFGWRQEDKHRPKIWRPTNGILIGGAGSVRTTQVVHHHVDWCSAPVELNEGWMVKHLVPAMRTAFDSYGVTENRQGKEWANIELLICSQDELWCVSSDYSITRSSKPYLAIGSGGTVADGALFALIEGDRPTHRAALRHAKVAVEAASYHAYGVGGPIDTYEVIRGK